MKSKNILFSKLLSRLKYFTELTRNFFNSSFVVNWHIHTVQLAKAYSYSICLHQNDHQFHSTRGPKILYSWIVKVNTAEPGFYIGDHFK